ncbi:MAG: alpha/beta hydrolase [Pseudomonadota bacterium]
MSDFIRIPTNPVPAGGEALEIETTDNATLRMALFPAEKAKGTVVLLNGRCEFIEKYFEVIEDLRGRGLNVATMDWRGQGLSSRMLPVSDKGHIPDFGAYKSDLRNFVEDIVKPRFGGPMILMTHSMGGLPALMLLADGDETFVRAVLCAPMTRLFPSLKMRVFSRTLAGLAHNLGWSRVSLVGVKEYSLDFEGNVLTSDPRRHERFRELQAAAPNACVFAPTYGWLNAAIKGMDDIHQPERLNSIKIPVRIISAENDKLVDPDDHRELAAANSAIDCITIKGALHEILMERDEIRDQYWQAFDEFVTPVLDE